MHKKEKRLKNLVQFSSDYPKKLASKPICVKLPEEIDAAIRKLPDTSSWLREVIVKAAIECQIYTPELDQDK